MQSIGFGWNAIHDDVTVKLRSSFNGRLRSVNLDPVEKVPSLIPDTNPSKLTDALHPEPSFTPCHTIKQTKNINSVSFKDKNVFFSLSLGSID